MSFIVEFILNEIASKNKDDFWMFYVISHSRSTELLKLIRLKVSDLERELIPGDKEGVIRYFHNDLGLKDKDYCFPGRQNGHISYRQVIRKWKGYKTGINLRSLSHFQIGTP